MCEKVFEKCSFNLKFNPEKFLTNEMGEKAVKGDNLLFDSFQMNLKHKKCVIMYLNGDKLS